MNIKLTKDMEAYVDALVQTGQYRSVGDVIDDALNLLARKQDKDALSERLRISMKQAMVGTGTVVDDAFFDRLKQKVTAAGA
jgi:putative addiction module CopG family antidote